MVVDKLLAASRRKQLARIHILKKNLRMTDDDYRDLLESTTGKRSASIMTIEERGVIIETLEAKERGAS